MQVSAIGPGGASAYADSLRAALAARSQAQSTASRPLDSDGDRDGSTAAPGRLDVRA